MTGAAERLLGGDFIAESFKHQVLDVGFKLILHDLYLFFSFHTIYHIIARFMRLKQVINPKTIAITHTNEISLHMWISCVVCVECVESAKLLFKAMHYEEYNYIQIFIAEVIN